MIEIRMPALSPTMEKGTLAKWLVAEGDRVEPGDLIAEIETDKATMELEADQAGRIARLVMPAGSEDVAVGTVIALIGEAVAGEVEAAPVAAEPVGELVGAGAALPPPAEAAPPPAPRHDPPPAIDLRGDATPLARRIAAFRGIALAGINGTGPRGRIVKADLGLDPVPVAAVAQVEAPAPAAIAPPPQGVPVETVKLGTMRRTIARRLTESKQSVPHFYLTARCRMDALMKLRAELNAGLAGRGVKLSVNEMLIKALARALVAEPDAHVQFGGDVLHRFGRVDVSMAVAIDGGLVTPVIRGADTLSLGAIAAQSRALAEKARDGKLMPEDYADGTVSISNLGMFGIDGMVPVINPPQALILGTPAGVEQPWKVDGAIALATIMDATASFDHRAIDGATGARFMAAFREHVEQPVLLIA